MADHNATKTTTGDQTLTPSLPTSDEDPPPPDTAADVEKELLDPDLDLDPDPDASRDSKRRKMCPKALEKIEEFVPPTRSLSFTFDTKFGACGPDATPKFGSFHSVKELTAMDQACQIPAGILESKEEASSEVETEVVGVFKVVEGVELDDRQFPTQIGQNLEL